MKDVATWDNANNYNAWVLKPTYMCNSGSSGLFKPPMASKGGQFRELLESCGRSSLDKGLSDEYEYCVNIYNRYFIVYLIIIIFFIFIYLSDLPSTADGS